MLCTRFLISTLCILIVVQVSILAAHCSWKVLSLGLVCLLSYINVPSFIITINLIIPGMCIILKYFLYHFNRKAQGLCSGLKTGLNPYCRTQDCLTRGPPKMLAHLRCWPNLAASYWDFAHPSS